MKSDRSNSGYPLVVLTVGVVLTSGSLILLMWLLFDVNTSYRDVIHRAIQVDRLKGDILRLDEVLTMSARMGAATGDRQWEKRYLREEQALDKAMRQVLKLLPDDRLLQSTAKTDAANERLVALEKEAFAAIDKGEGSAARALLSSPEYEMQKIIYAQGMADLSSNLDRNVDDSIDLLQEKSMVAIAIAVALIPLVLLFWIYALRTLERWKNFVLDLNQNLDAEVLRRTEELQTEQIRSLSSSKMATLGEMAGGIAHEINNPLGIIQGYVDRLILSYDDGLPMNAEGARAICAKIHAATVRISKIVQGLRSFSRDGSRDPMEISSLKTIIEQTLILCQEKMQSKDIVLKVNNTQPDILINCRPVEISQVLLNLLHNAFDALEDVPQKLIEIDIGASAGEVRIAVTDSGIGIPPALREKIMQPFFSTKPVGKGTGLGLSISRTLISNHAGRLELKDSLRGASFTIILPLPQTHLKAS